MATRIFFALIVLALCRIALSTQGDICYVIGAKTTLVDDRLYFISGNYSIVSFDGQDITPTASLYSLSLSSQFPVERSIPQGLLSNDTIDSDITVAYNSALRTSSGDATGALWHSNDTIYVFGGGFETPTSTLSAYNVTAGKWKDVKAAGGAFNFGNRTSSQYVSAPGSGLHFIYGGTTPYMGGMLRLDASDPDNLSWTNETLGNGSHGVKVPNLESGAMVYIPAGKEGMLISFGGSNVTAGIDPDWGWPYDSDWLTVYVYDIASHTWWVQEASGSAPLHKGSFCTAVTASPDGGAFHITTYGGWSLNYGRSYEDVHVLSIPSFTWIDATDLSNESNKEQQVNSTIGRDSLTGSCQTYKGARMIVLGGGIRAGAYSLTNGACSNVFEPVRVLDLSKYEWQTELDTNASYEVPPIIYDKIGGDATGGATSTVPSAGFADATLSSLLQLRVATATGGTASSKPSNSSATGTPENHSHSVNAGAIAGGVVGGVVGLALIAGMAWFLLRRRRGAKGDAHAPHRVGKGVTSPQVQEMDASYSNQVDAYGRPLRPGGGMVHEFPVSPAAAELDSTARRHM